MQWTARLNEMHKRRQELELLPLTTLRGMLATMNAAILPNNGTHHLPSWQRFVFSILRHEFPTMPNYDIDWDCAKLEDDMKNSLKHDLSQA